jgi:periplasmic copper chaperone A
MSLLALLRGMLLVLLFAACGSQTTARAEPGLYVDDVWARPVHLGSGAVEAGEAHAGHAGQGSDRNGVVYLTLRNTRAEADRLVGVESPVAHLAEIHHSQLEDGIMRMRRVGTVSVGGGETVEFRPGGLHLMLIHLDRSLQPGERFPVRLHLEQEGWREVEAEVRAP